MCNKFIIALTALLFGILVFPKESLACAMHASESTNEQHSCCTQEDEKQTKDTCTHHQNTKSDQDSGCAGSCDTKSCHSSVQPVFVHQQLGTAFLLFAFEDNSTYPFYKQPFACSGFGAIWQPPKIA